MELATGACQNGGMTAETIARLRISLDDIRPEIWRVVEIQTSASLRAVHDVIQAAMGWQDCHLWEFDASGHRYGLPDPQWPINDLAAAKNTRLSTLIERGVRTMTYTYDLGDDWRHTVSIEAVEQGDGKVTYPRFVSGQGRCPPEDVGGRPGFESFLEAIADPAHPEHRALLRWYGRPYDPEDMGECAAKRRIGIIARRRLAAKAAGAKRRTATVGTGSRFSARSKA
jgi:hypothetical protein